MWLINSSWKKKSLGFRGQVNKNKHNLVPYARRPTVRLASLAVFTVPSDWAENQAVLRSDQEDESSFKGKRNAQIICNAPKIQPLECVSPSSGREAE